VHDEADQEADREEEHDRQRAYHEAIIEQNEMASTVAAVRRKTAYEEEASELE